MALVHKEVVMADLLGGAVKAMEDEAARLLDEARAAGDDILREAREQAADIEAAELDLADAETECEARIKAARGRAAELVKQAEDDAAALRERSAGKLGDYARQIVRIVSGEVA